MSWPPPRSPEVCCPRSTLALRCWCISHHMMFMKNTDCDHYAVLFRVLCRHIAPDSSRRRYNDEAAAGGVGTPQNNLHGLETSIQRLLSSINGLLLFMLLIMRGFYCNCLLKLTMNHVYTLHDYNEVLFVHIFVL